ncbi:hypothetical protein [Flavobacterium sp.]
MMSNAKILQELDQLEAFADILKNKASMLKKELSGVVSDSSPQKGLGSQQKASVISKREQSRLRK